MIEILNIKINSIQKSEFLKRLNSGIIITPNVDHLVKLQKDKEFYDCYNKANWIICDSKILFLCAKFLGSPLKEVIPGSSFFPQYCDYHKNNLDVKIFLLGAAPGVAFKAMNNINIRIGRNIIVGAHSPSFGFEKNEKECEEIIDIINKTDATVLVVGVGAPKQEKWILKNRDKFSNIKLFMALGATIDFEAGSIKRAPKLYQSLGLEWFYRLIKEPKRLWKRYLVDDVPFFYYILKQKLGFYKNPFEMSQSVDGVLIEHTIIKKSTSITSYIREALEYWGKLPRLTAFLFGTSPKEEVQIPEELLPDHLKKSTAIPAGQSAILVKKTNEVVVEEDQEALNVG